MKVENPRNLVEQRRIKPKLGKQNTGQALKSKIQSQALAVKILCLPSIVPIGKTRWRLLNHDSRTHYLYNDESKDQNAIPF